MTNDKPVVRHPIPPSVGQDVLALVSEMRSVLFRIESAVNLQVLEPYDLACAKALWIDSTLLRDKIKALLEDD